MGANEDDGSVSEVAAPLDRLVAGPGSRFHGVVVEDAPEWVVARAVAEFRAGTAPASSWLDRAITTVRAALAFDDWTGAPALALRGPAAADGGPRHLVYGADGVEVALSLYPEAEGGTTIVGQVLAADPEAQLVEVLATGGVVASGTTSATGEFVVVAPGVWDELVIVGADTEIVIDAIAPGSP